MRSPAVPVPTSWAEYRLRRYTQVLVWLICSFFAMRLLRVVLAWHRGEPSGVVDFLFDDSYKVH